MEEHRYNMQHKGFWNQGSKGLRVGQETQHEPPTKKEKKEKGKM